MIERQRAKLQRACSFRQLWYGSAFFAALHDAAITGLHQRGRLRTLLGWYTCRETRSAVTAVIVLMTFAWVADTMKMYRMSCISHTMGHVLLVVILAAYSRVVSRTFSPA